MFKIEAHQTIGMFCDFHFHARFDLFFGKSAFRVSLNPRCFSLFSRLFVFSPMSCLRDFSISYLFRFHVCYQLFKFEKSIKRDLKYSVSSLFCFKVILVLVLWPLYLYASLFVVITILYVFNAEKLSKWLSLQRHFAQLNQVWYQLGIIEQCLVLVCIFFSSLRQSHQVLPSKTWDT